MYGKVRDFFNSTDTQIHICNILAHTLRVYLTIALKNESFHEQDISEIKEKTDNLKRTSDLTVLSKVFMEKFNYKNEYEMWKTGTLASVIRSATDRNAPIRTKYPNIGIESLYSRIRELAPLIRLIREHRNHFSHLNTMERKGTGWNSSVLTSIIRLCEISEVSKESLDSNKKIISDCETLLIEVLDVSVGNTTFPEKEEKKIEKNNDQKAMVSIEDINNKLDLIRGEIRSYHEGFDEKLINKILIENASNVQEEEEEENSSGIQNDNFEEKITPEVLRTELRILSGKINTHFEKDKSFSPGLNLVTLSSISEILDNEPESLNKFLQLENIKFVIDQHPKIYNKQIKEFGKDLDALLENVLWPMEI